MIESKPRQAIDLTHLPIELLTQTLSHLVVHDLQQVRLTSKLLEDCVSTLNVQNRIYERYPLASSVPPNARIGDRSNSVTVQDDQVLVNQLRSQPEGLLYVHVSQTLRDTQMLESPAGNYSSSSSSPTIDSKQHGFLAIQGRYIYHGNKQETKVCSFTDLTIYKF